MKDLILTDGQTLWAFLTFLVAFIACCIYFVQALLSRKQIKDDHERSRRERTVDLLLEWFRELEHSNTTARKFAEDLDDTSLKAIWKGCDFFIPKNSQNLSYLKKIFDDEFSESLFVEKSNSSILHVSDYYSEQIRWKLITYLNFLEAILAAWVNETADRQLIEEEFQYMFDHDDGTLKRFRNITAGSYPCIDLFEEDMLKKRKSPLRKKYGLGFFSKNK